MMPPLTTTGEAQPPQPVELSGTQIQQLRNASGWARFLAIAGFIVTGVLALGLIAIVVKMRGRLSIGNKSTVIGLGVTGAAATLLWLYGRDVRAFFGRGEPSLTPAFRRLRVFFKVWAIYVGLSTAMDVAALLGKL